MSFRRVGGVSERQGIFVENVVGRVKRPLDDGETAFATEVAPCAIDRGGAVRLCRGGRHRGAVLNEQLGVESKAILTCPFSAWSAGGGWGGK